MRMLLIICFYVPGRYWWIILILWLYIRFLLKMITTDVFFVILTSGGLTFVKKSRHIYQKDLGEV